MTGTLTVFRNCIVEYNPSGVPTGVVWIEGTRYTGATGLPSGPISNSTGKYTIAVDCLSGVVANQMAATSTTKDNSSAPNSSGVGGVSTSGEITGIVQGTVVEIAKPGQSEDANAVAETAVLTST
jgi:hypothetical protein